VDARLPDGSRVNAIIPPLALDGPVLSIRRFAADPYRMADLVEFGTLTSGLAEILRAAVQARLNILVSGGTGAGKTTMLNVLSNAIPNTERIVTIEDSAELQLQQEHVVRLETRPSNIEAQGAVTQRDLLRNALRMRPDRIVVGEVRGPEVLDMLQAMNTGHDGSLSTVHANSTRDDSERGWQNTPRVYADLDHDGTRDPGEPMDKNMYELPPEELAQVASVPDSLRGAIEALQADHSFLLRGDVFNENFIANWIDMKQKEYDALRLRPHPYEFAMYYDV